ncbi:MAG: DNA primase [Candidatus Bathyarchaeota archaeon]|nr:MAG: DNA primase [Candidatus Bathyarchaeota archaeon]
MGTSQSITAKYLVRAKFEVEGVVEKSDAIGAVFGQTEGLFGPELDLRELQKSGRIGRIEIQLESKKDKTAGTLNIPTSMDKVSTVILAASLESIDRVGPCAAKITLEKIEDVRNARRTAIIKRAKEILLKWTIEALPSTEEVFREVSETLRLARVEAYGPEKLTAGPDIESSKEIVIVEGRADVINLLRCGIQNAIAVEGAKIPKTIIKLSKEKEATAFLDGDRGGDLILKELIQVANIKHVARAPSGKEVEDLTAKQVASALKRKITVTKPKMRAHAKPRGRQKTLVPKQIAEVTKEIDGTLEAVLFDAKMKKIDRLPVSKLADKLKKTKNVDTVVFDGVITQRLVDMATEKNIKYIVAARLSDTIQQPLGIHLLTFTQVRN